MRVGECLQLMDTTMRMFIPPTCSVCLEGYTFGKTAYLFCRGSSGAHGKHSHCTETVSSVFWWVRWYLREKKSSFVLLQCNSPSPWWIETLSMYGCQSAFEKVSGPSRGSRRSCGLHSTIRKTFYSYLIHWPWRPRVPESHSKFCLQSKARPFSFSPKSVS